MNAKEKEEPVAGLGGRHQHAPEHRTSQANSQLARGGEKTSPIRIPADIREAIKKTHPIESCFLEHLLEKKDPRVILVEEGT